MMMHHYWNNYHGGGVESPTSVIPASTLPSYNGLHDSSNLQHHHIGGGGSYYQFTATSSSSRSPPDDDGSGRRQPQNLRDTPERQAKVKTEMCSYFEKDISCPFGKKCEYPHTVYMSIGELHIIW